MCQCTSFPSRPECNRKFSAQGNIFAVYIQCFCYITECFICHVQVGLLVLFRQPISKFPSPDRKLIYKVLSFYHLSIAYILQSLSLYRLQNRGFPALFPLCLFLFYLPEVLQDILLCLFSCFKVISENLSVPFDEESLRLPVFLTGKLSLRIHIIDSYASFPRKCNMTILFRPFTAIVIPFDLIIREYFLIF